MPVLFVILRPKIIAPMPSTLQDRILEEVVSRYSKKSEAVDQLSELFNIGKDAVYRRLRGDTLLTPAEMAQLAQHYRLSIDNLIFDQTDTVFFTFNQFAQSIRNFDDYLEAIYQSIDHMQKLPEVTVYYVTSEIPLFCYCFFPELISFKLYMWGRTVWDFDFLHDKKFHLDILPAPTMRLTQTLLDQYKNFPSTELWSLNLVDNTLNQIEYYASAGGFEKPEDALLLCNQVEELIDHLKRMAEQGKKFSLGSHPNKTSADFNLYHNEMVYINNTILAVSPQMHKVFIAYGNPNYLTSSDQKICHYTEDFMHNIMARCNSISAHDERSREWFFNRLLNQVGHSRKRIQLIVEELEQ
jgi:hypothetical protein